jgi:Flp pilus assembly protein TadG
MIKRRSTPRSADPAAAGPRSLLARFFRGPLSRAGSTAVEFAVGLPIFLSMLFGVMEGGRALFTQAVLFYAAQEATRWAVVNPRDVDGGETLADYEARIKTYAQSKIILISSNKTVAIPTTSPEDPIDNTRTITVTVNYQFDWMMPFVSAATGPITLTANSSGFLAEN